MFEQYQCAGVCWCVRCHSGCPHTLRSRSVQINIILSAQSVVECHSGKRVFTQCKILFISCPCHSWRVYIIRPHMAHMAVVWHSQSFYQTTTPRKGLGTWLYPIGSAAHILRQSITVSKLSGMALLNPK